MMKIKVVALIILSLLLLSLIKLGRDFFINQKKITQASMVSNQANTIINQLSDPVDDKQLEKSIDLYRQSLALHEDTNTRWNYEKTKEFLEKRSSIKHQTSEQSHNNGLPTTGNLQESTENQQLANTGSYNPQPSSGQQITNNGQVSDSGSLKDEYGESGTGNTQLSESEKNKLQNYQQQLQVYQEHIAQDSQQYKASNSNDFFGGLLFEHFFGGKNPFEEYNNSYEKDW